MGRVTVAFRVFFKALFDGEFARRLGVFVEREGAAEQAGGEVSVKAGSGAPGVAAAVSTRSDALTLLAVLQREGRLIDFLKEDIAGYGDAQIGAAVRDVHRDAGAALERMLALRPVMDGAEGAEVAIPAGAVGGRVRLVGNLTGTPPAKGRLAHAGWEATRVDLPVYSGGVEGARVVAPAEVEV